MPCRGFSASRSVCAKLRARTRERSHVTSEGDGKRIVGPRTNAYMTADHLDASIAPGPLYLPGAGFGFGLGFAVRKDVGVSPFLGSAGEYNWGGAGGTYFWVDPQQDLFVVFMMQSPKQRLPYRQTLKAMVYSAIAKPGAK